MAIAFDTISSKLQGTASSQSSSTFAIANVSNRLLLVGLVYQSTTGTISSVKWNTSETMTLLAGPLTIGSERIYVFGLLNPTATTASFTVAKDESSAFITCYGLSYNGVSQSGLPDASNTATGSSATPGISVTTVADNCWLFSCLRQLTAGATVAGTNTTKRDPGTDIACDVGDSNAAQTPAGSHSQNWGSSSGSWGLVAVSFAPPGTPATAKGALLMSTMVF